MKLSNENINSLKSKTLGLALAAVLIPGGLAMANDHRHMGARSDLSGHVEVVHEIPGGVVTVGADWGRPRPTVVVQQPPQVVVVQQQPQPQVVVIEKDRGHGHGYGRGYGHGRGHHRDREVTIIREEPRRPQVVVVEKRVENCDRNDRGGNSHYYNDGKQVSVDRQDHNGQYHYYNDGKQVSETRTDRSGTYHYYEDARQVSIQDNRDGRNRNVYVQK
jgi:hypothetical protein